MACNCNFFTKISAEAPYSAYKRHELCKIGRLVMGSPLHYLASLIQLLLVTFPIQWWGQKGDLLEGIKNIITCLVGIVPVLGGMILSMDNFSMKSSVCKSPQPPTNGVLCEGEWNGLSVTAGFDLPPIKE